MAPKTDPKADPKAKPKTENRQGRALGAGTVSGARRARRLAEFGPPTGVPRNEVDAPALKKALNFLVEYVFLSLLPCKRLLHFLMNSYFWLLLLPCKRLLHF